MRIDFYTSENIPASFYELEPELYNEIELKMKGKTVLETDFLEGVLTCESEGHVIGRLAIYINPAHQIDDQQIGAIGFFECEDSKETCRMLIEEAMAYFKTKSINKVIGPLNGSTWNSYRFRDVTNNPHFFSETVHKSYYPALFKQAGFTEYANYISNISELPDQGFEYTLPLNYSLRKINLDDYENELKKVFPFFDQSFQNSLFYNPITEDEFVIKYLNYKPYLKDYLIWFLEENEEVIAVMFGLHNHFDPTNQSAIIKTLARNPDSKYKGIGDLLMKYFYNQLLGNGYKKVIHAFMRYDNIGALKTSDKYLGDAYASYKLFAKDLNA